jgi:hypothetical protein
MPKAELDRGTLDRRTVERRAVEAVIWGMAVVNYDLMLQEMLGKTAGKVNQLIYWGRPLDWKNQTLTPHPDTLYFMSFLDTKDAGPIVIEVPPADATGSLNANFVNVWQQPLEDAGLLGVDKGKPFAPDAGTKQALDTGIGEAHAWLAAKYDGGLPPFFEGTHWTYPAHLELLKAAADNFDNPDAFPID